MATATSLKALKAVVAKENTGMGLRSWRIAFIINENGIVEWAGVEEGQRANASDDPYEETTPNKVIDCAEGTQRK